VIHGYYYDDPFITYRYSDHIAHGLGFTYNAGNRTLSTTTPLFTLLGALITLLGGQLPVVSNVIGIICLLAGCCVFTLLLPDEMPALWRGLSGVLLALMAPPLAALGSEIPLQILLLLLTCLFFKIDKPIAAGSCAGLATVNRPDGAVILVALVLTYAAQKRTKDVMRAAVSFALVAIPWYLFSTVYFGSPIPATLAAKQHQSHVNGGYGFFRGLLTTLNFIRKDCIAAYHKLLGNAEFAVMALLVVSGILATFRQRRPPLLIIWAALYITGYTVLGVRYYTWYYAPLFSVGVWLLSTGMFALYTRIRDAKAASGYALPAIAVAAVIALSLFYVEGEAIAPYANGGSYPHYKLYRTTGEWLATSTPPNATVGALQIGIMGYYAHRNVVDFAGLIEPDVSRAGGKSYLDWATYAIQKYKPDYIALDVPWGNDISDQSWFKARYHQVHAMPTSPIGSVVIYQNTTSSLALSSHR
jgi:hypothetical protein